MRYIVRKKTDKMTRQEITAFYNTHYRRLYSISYRIVLDAMEAEEIMQDTIMKYISSAPKLDAPEKVSAWLTRTCIRMSISALRRHKRDEEFLSEYERPEDTSEDVTEETFDAVRLRDALAGLKDIYRVILNLVLIEGLDYSETASYLGEPESTVRSKFSRGKKKLLEILGHHDNR